MALSLDSLLGLTRSKPPKGEAHVPSGIHKRRWCRFHGKVCCFAHGKHKEGKILNGPTRH